MSSRPRGPITTLLDLTDRDAQENDIFPLTADQTWFTRDPTRATIAFTPQIQSIPFRGPAAFGQRFTFDLGSIVAGDLLFGAVLELKLAHWLDSGTLNRLAAGVYTYADPSGAGAWEYANSLGTICIAKAELEIDGVTVETIDGDFIDVFSRLFGDYNTQVGVAYDHIARLPIPTLRGLAAPRNFPTEDGCVHCPLPFFFGRTRYREALPMIAIKEGLTRLHVTLRPFREVVRLLRGWRDTCDAVPISQSIPFLDLSGNPVAVSTAIAEPGIDRVVLLTHGALLDGAIRQTMLRKPFEMLHREVQTFFFEEPLKYAVAKRSETDTILIQLPLEANHPVEEILWFVRRKGTSANNEWTNYSAAVEREWGVAPRFQPKPLLVSAKLQVNGLTLIEQEEQWFREHIGRKHKGGYAAYANFLYGISFAEQPGEHQPSGSINASRANSLRLTLEVKPPQTAFDDGAWEVKVFVIALNWMRFENGLAGAVFED